MKLTIKTSPMTNFSTPGDGIKKATLALSILSIFCLAAFGALKDKDKNTLRTKQADTAIPAKPTDISPLLIGESVPQLTLPDANGNAVNLNQKITEKPTILIFYRGGWCPFCNKQLAGIQSIESDLRKMGYQILAISTDSPENLSKSRDKHQLTYTLLSDSELSAAKQFGIAFVAPKAYDQILTEGSNGKNAAHLLPVPSVFILDRQGIIQFEYINPDFKQRISPDLLTAVATTLLKDVKAKR
ncbi:AhpC/TSA family protein [Mucilaginibacter sp. RS28]|uniref:thioredoxin-dependent peroxiredoxin n=1 Tax=Mucilaginibacter straminoryzae TaxID=2932774 RepID=A0A9X1X2I2_9SPHI|nr:peroxiredoxin-like family protein [Mucilaginibacter straminoryzae]MCJ8209135.1 AhpC/TSA family protein [Mucilaginibacter straminoryzae]